MPRGRIPAKAPAVETASSSAEDDGEEDTAISKSVLRQEFPDEPNMPQPPRMSIGQAMSGAPGNSEGEIGPATEGQSGQSCKEANPSGRLSDTAPSKTERRRSTSAAATATAFKDARLSRAANLSSPPGDRPRGRTPHAADGAQQPSNRTDEQHRLQKLKEAKQLKIYVADVEHDLDSLEELMAVVRVQRAWRMRNAIFEIFGHLLFVRRQVGRRSPATA